MRKSCVLSRTEIDYPSLNIQSMIESWMNVCGNFKHFLKRVFVRRCSEFVHQNSRYDLKLHGKEIVGNYVEDVRKSRSSWISDVCFQEK